MTVLDDTGGTAGARGPIARAAGFRVELVARLETGRGALERLSIRRRRSRIRDGCEAWYGAFAGTDGVEPLIAVITRCRDIGEQVALLPLIRRRQNGIRIVEFADLDLTDYNAPMLGPAAPRDAGGARAVARSAGGACASMPGGADLIRLRKMPVDLDGRPNPLALLDGAGPCSLNGNVVTTGDDFDAWRYSLERTVRKELERSWRVFTRDPGAGFRLVTDHR